VKRLAVPILLALLLSPALAEDALPATATLTITVRHIIDAGGDLKLGIYDEANFAKKGGIPVARKSTNAHGPTMSLIFDGLPPGIYAVKVLQDVNRNGNFDMGLKGVEPFGFSNDAPVTAGLPAFDDAKFTVTAGSNSIEITLR
jgi:uncharacterized protein (DUF2141 family)